MDGNDLIIWERVAEKLKTKTMYWHTDGECISIYWRDGRLAGSFETVNDIYNYLCGYETGFSVGETEGFKKGRKK